MKKIRLALTIILMLSILSVALLFMAPSFMDWNKNKDIIENIASDFLGYKVHIKGDLEVQLLPNPKIYADDVVIDALVGNESIATIDQVILNKKLSDLIAFDISIDKAILNRLKINLVTDESNVNNWEPVKVKNQAYYAKKVKQTLNNLKLFKDVSVENASISYNNYTTNSSINIQKIYTNIKNIEDRLVISGSTELDDLKQEFSASLDISNPALIKSSFGLKNDRYKLSAQGGIENFYNIAKSEFKGRVEAEFGDANIIKTNKTIDYIKKTYFDLKEFKLESNLTVSKNLFDLNNMNIKSKYNQLTGDIKYLKEDDSRSIDVKLDISKAYIKRDDVFDSEKTKNNQSHFEWSDNALDFSFLDKLKVGVNLNCKECAYGNNKFYDINLKAALENKNLIINQFNMRSGDEDFIKFKANGTLNSPIAFDTYFEAKDFPLETLLSADILDKLKFNLNGTANMSSSGVSEKNVFANMSGNFDFDIQSLELNNIDDSDIRRMLSGLLFDMGRVNFKSNIKDFKIAGSVRDGVIRNSDITFKMSGEDIVAKGKFDLANLTANYRVEPVNIRKNNLGVVLSGNINDLELIPDKITPKGVLDGFNRIVTTDIVKRSKRSQIKTPFDFDDQANLKDNVTEYLFSE